MKILLIEDDAITVETIRIGLAFYYPTSTITPIDKGLDAIKILKSEYFDVVILDLGLPDIDGLDVLEQLRSFSQIPVVVASARNNPEAIYRTMRAGANDYITKPFIIKRLIDSLNKYVGKCIVENCSLNPESLQL